MTKAKPQISQKKELDFIDFLNAQYGTRDSDHDGLTDEVELFLGTDPLKADTDDDGMSDLEEIRAGRNPLGPGGWQNWFLPHEGNGYHPASLHPQRLLFYAGAALVSKILVALFVLGLPMTAWLSPDILREQAQKIIALTNSLRTSLDAPILAESPALDRAAYAKANDMLLQQYFAHVGPDKKSLSSWLKEAGYRYTVAGENLALGFNSAEEVLTAWQASPTHYANLIDKEFTQIGVSVVSGPYQDTDTTVVAQYFGTPPVVAMPIKAEPVAVPAKVEAVTAKTSQPQVASQKELAQVTTQVKTESTPVTAEAGVKTTVQALPPLDASKTNLWLDTPQGSKEAVARAEVVLNYEAKEAQIIFSSYRLALTKDESGVWRGQAIISDRATLEPIVPPELSVVALDGQVKTHSLSWSNLQPTTSSAGERYMFLRNNPSPEVAKIFGFSDWFYRLILFGAVMSLSVAVVVEIKKQKPKLIISTSALIALLVILLIF